MSTGVLYFLFVVVTSGSLPSFAPVAAFQDEASCIAARDAIVAAIADGQEASTFVCYSGDKFEALNPDAQ